MQVIYPAGSENVGDELNGWLWPALLGDIENDSGKQVLLGIGTLLNKHFCERLRDAEAIHVLGTGAGYGEPPRIDSRWHWHAVRGPLSARAMGLADDRAVADAAYLLATLDWADWCPTGADDVVVVPHHRSLRLVDWEQVCARAGLTFLSPLLPAESFMRALCNARLVITEAMHGAILADILRKPWVAFSFGRQFAEDKWQDWAQAFDLSLTLHRLLGFYDTARHGAGRGLPHHAGNWLKAELWRRGLGKRKWRSLTPPGWPLTQALTELEAQLKRLALESGQLSGEQVFRQRVAQLHERVNDMRRQLGADPILPLGGSPERFFSGVRP
ncbi:MAG: polysaccharide pyruvyl transferase family protein [Pseudomonadaceae bacterium]|nr:polysaccharide pyruvyl transferase family protein [Pseudomonadaceae bacterium]